MGTYDPVCGRVLECGASEAELFFKPVRFKHQEKDYGCWENMIEKTLARVCRADQQNKNQPLNRRKRNVSSVTLAVKLFKPGRSLLFRKEDGFHLSVHPGWVLPIVVSEDGTRYLEPYVKLATGASWLAPV